MKDNFHLLQSNRSLHSWTSKRPFVQSNRPQQHLENCVEVIEYDKEVEKKTHNPIHHHQYHVEVVAAQKNEIK